MAMAKDFIKYYKAYIINQYIWNNTWTSEKDNKVHMEKPKLGKSCRKRG